MPPFKILTLPTPLDLLEAIKMLEAGLCLGIRPGNNTRYMRLFKPERGAIKFYWQDETVGTLNVEQITGQWFLVVIDHREIQST